MREHISKGWTRQGVYQIRRVREYPRQRPRGKAMGTLPKLDDTAPVRLAPERIRVVPSGQGLTNGQTDFLARKFASKVPVQERQDVYQDVWVKLLDVKPPTFKFAWAIAHNLLVDWWRAFKIREHFSLDMGLHVDDEGNAQTLADILVSEVDCIAQIEGKLDGQKLWEQIPRPIQTIIRRKLVGQKLWPGQGQELARFATAHWELLTA